jgi:nitroreductase
VWNEYVALSQTGTTPFTVVAPAGYTLDRSGAPTAGTVPNQLLDDITNVPVMLVVAADLGRIAVMDKDLDRMPMAGGASVFPFCWSILLSARARGLGGVLTTFMSRVEPEVASLLGLPPDHALVATIYLGYPVKQATKLKRHPVSSFATIDRFDGSPLDDPAP